MTVTYYEKLYVNFGNDTLKDEKYVKSVLMCTKSSILNVLIGSSCPHLIDAEM